jgi:tetratricopeptide (TPR) repeat protein
VLCDEQARARYVEELAAGGKVELDVTGILESERAFQTATALVRGRRYDEAMVAIEEALLLNPDEAEFAIWRAWVQFLVAPDKKKQQAESAATMEAALQKNPRCVAGYLFLGQMAKVLGDAPAAERHWRRGLEVEPDHGELSRELKYLRK